MPSPRKPSPSRSPTALTCSRWRPLSAQVSCRFSSGAPDSSSWPAGSRLIVPSAPASAMILPPSIDRLPAEFGQPVEQVADAAGLVVATARGDRSGDRRTSHARCRCASRRAAFRRPRRSASRSSRLSIERACATGRCAWSSIAPSRAPRSLQSGFAIGRRPSASRPTAAPSTARDRGKRGGLGAKDARAKAIAVRARRGADRGALRRA